jgi:hypothetical protein
MNHRRKYPTAAVVLTDDLLQRAREAARSETLSVSDIVRRALTAYFAACDVTHSNPFPVSTVTVTEAPTEAVA